jgi:maleate cis-trans isomerase
MTSSASARDNIYGHRARIGYTSPPLTTEVFPYEFYKIVPSGVTLVVTTLAIVVRSKGEVDQSYDISMKAAREMAAAGVDIIMLGGVPINLSRGTANAEQMIVDLEAELNVKVSTSASAQAKAAKALGCKKVVVAQPTAVRDRPDCELCHSFRLRGAGATGWGSAFNQIGRIPAMPPSRWAASSARASRCRLDPLPSPHWPTAEAIDARARARRRVMAAHQAIVWDALRRCGVNDRIGDSAGCSGNF